MSATYANKNGNITIIALIGIVTCMTTLLLYLKISFSTEKCLVRKSLADICTKQLVTILWNSNEKIDQTNTQISILQKVVYASRGLSITGALAKISEKAALNLLRILKIEQDTYLQLQSAKIISSLSCKQNQLTTENAFCLSSPSLISRAYIRKKTIFSDVPGTLDRINNSKWFGECAIENFISKITLDFIGSEKFQYEK